MARADAMLAGDQLSNKEIAHELGDYSASHFSLALKRFYEQSSFTWRENLMR
jgi:AraC-like DNA-binding protein